MECSLNKLPLTRNSRRVVVCLNLKLYPTMNMTPHCNCVPAARTSSRIRERFNPKVKALTAAAIMTATGIAFGQPNETVTLSPFEVKASNKTGDRYASEQSNAGTIIAKDREKIPLVTTVLTEEFLADAGLSDPAQYAQFVSGMSNSSDGKTFTTDVPQSSGNLNFMIRGFNSEPLFNGFKADGMIRNPDNVGRVEVIKTPNSVLYGQGAAGGIIDISTKVPTFGKQTGSVMLGAGTSDSSSKGNSRRGRVDLNGSLGDNAAIRLNAGYQQFDKEQYFFESKVFGLGGALKYRIGERTTIDISPELTIFKGVPSRTAAFVSAGAGTARVVDPFNRLRADRNFTYSGPYSNGHRTTNLNTFVVTTKVTDSITVRVGALYGAQDATSLIYNTNLSLAATDTAANWARITEDKHVNGQKVDVVHQGSLLGWSIDTLFGYENHSYRNASTNLQTSPAATPTPITIPFTRATIASDWPLPPGPQTFTVLNANQRTRLAWTNMRVSQFIESKNKRGSIMWGVARGDGSNVASNLANNTSAKSVGKGDTYTAGGTYKVIDQGNSGLLNGISIFAGTSSSFVIQGGNQQDPKKFNGFTTVQALKDYIASLAPNPVDPQKGKGWEVGTRFQLLDRRVSVSVAYFDQQRENISRSFFVRQSLVPGETNELALATYQLASGKEQSKGVDADITWQFTNSFSFLAGAMLSQGKVLSNPESPEEVGFGLVSSPETQYNFWISYRAPKESILSGLSAGLGASYKSSTRIRPQVADRFRVSDAYTEGHAMLRYKIPGKKYSHELGLTIDNILDKEYTDEGNWLSDPRTFKGSYTISW